jgi:hypothetical protein
MSKLMNQSFLQNDCIFLAGNRWKWAKGFELEQIQFHFYMHLQGHKVSFSFEDLVYYRGNSNSSLFCLMKSGS